MNQIQQKTVLFSNHFELTEQVINVLTKETSWESRYRAIMLLGKQLPLLDEDLKREEAQVQGCESKVWLNYYWQDEHLHLAASSDAKIVKGLVAIVLAIFNKKQKQDITHFDVNSFFETIQLTKNLSPSRTNGLFAMVEEIRTIASN